MANKTYLDQEGLERLVQYINNALSGKANVGDIPANVVLQDDLADYVKTDELGTYIDEDELAIELSTYATEASLADVVREDDLLAYATNDALESLRGEVTGVYHYRGSVANLQALAAIENPAQGDVYNLEDTGMNAAWTGEVWDEFGTIADLSNCLMKEDVDAIPMPTVNSILYGGSRAIVSDVSGMQAMIANDEPEVEIVLNKSVSFTDTVSIAADKKVTLDLNGNKISIPSGKELVVNGELVIDGDGRIEAGTWGVNAYGEDAKVVLNSGKLTANESPMCIQGGASFEMNGGELEGFDNCPLMGQGSAGNGGTEMVMNGGTLKAHITSAGYIACGVYMPNNGRFIMNGGEIISDGAGLVMRAGEVELNGGSIVANGATGVKGKVGDSRVVVGPYAVVYDESAKYPGATAGLFQLTIGANMSLTGTDGDVSTLLSNGATANIIDNRA